MSKTNKANRFKLSEKQKLLLILVYMCKILPLQCLTQLSDVFTPTNLTYKIIPRLEQEKLIERKVIGYNRYGQSDTKLKGKALYDSIKLTRLGTTFVMCDLGTSDKVLDVHDYYSRINTHSDLKMQERFKRSIQTDFVFNKEYILKALLSCDFISLGTRNTLTQLLEETKISEKFQQKFYRGIDCKRFNFDINKLFNLTNEEYLSGTGNNLTSSKIVGIYFTTQKGYYQNIYPVYNANFYNVSINENVEAQLKNKLWSETGVEVNSCIYLFQDIQKIKHMVTTDAYPFWITTPAMIQSDLYNKIYAFKYDSNIVNQKKILYLDLITNNRKQLWTRYFLNNNIFSDIINEQSLTKARMEKPEYDAFIGNDLVYIGYEQELYSIKDLYKSIMENRDYNLTIICDEFQVEFYKQIFEELDNAKRLTIKSNIPIPVVKGD